MCPDCHHETVHIRACRQADVRGLTATNPSVTRPGTLALHGRIDGLAPISPDVERQDPDSPFDQSARYDLPGGVCTNCRAALIAHLPAVGVDRGDRLFSLLRAESSRWRVAGHVLSVQIDPSGRGEGLGRRLRHGAGAWRDSWRLKAVAAVSMRYSVMAGYAGDSRRCDAAERTNRHRDPQLRRG